MCFTVQLSRFFTFSELFFVTVLLSDSYNSIAHLTSNVNTLFIFLQSDTTAELLHLTVTIKFLLKFVSLRSLATAFIGYHTPSSMSTLLLSNFIHSISSINIEFLCLAKRIAGHGVNNNRIPYTIKSCHTYVTAFLNIYFKKKNLFCSHSSCFSFNLFTSNVDEYSKDNNQTNYHVLNITLCT